jgi:formylglycine-generating enzyme required for sulfatase activity
VWHDRKLLGGDEWRGQIDARLEEADLILLLVSRDFLASDYVNDVEIKRALERHARREARVVPIILRSCPWDLTPIGQANLQALPTDGVPVTDSRWGSPDDPWTLVIEGIHAIVQEMNKAGSPVGQQVRATESGDSRIGSSGLSSNVTTPSARGTEGGDSQGGGAEVDETRYLERVREENSYVELRGMGAQVAERLELAEVYTGLRAATASDQRRESRPEDRAGDGEHFDLASAPERDRALSEVLADHPNVVLIGDPGSGKTTFLRFVAQNVARWRLDRGDEAASESLGLAGDPPFPVFVRLPVFAQRLRSADDPELPVAAPEHFYRYLDFTQRGYPDGLPADYVRRRILGGGCFLLLDGLDEVPSRELRERVARIVEEVVTAGRQAGNRHLVACRTRAYEGRVQLAAGLMGFRLAPFEAPQVEEFVRRWCRALKKVPAGDEESAAAQEAERYRAELQGAIDGHGDLGPLTESPLMLTVLGVVHWNRRQLPEQRAELYEAAVVYLLESRRDQTSYGTPIRREGHEAVAARMFEDSEGVQRSLARTEAAETVAERLGIDRSEAVSFLEDEELYSGLLVSRMEGEVEFWHLTFQEYLAATDIAAVDYWTRIREHLHDDRWSEVVLLLAGVLRRGGLRPAGRFIQKILETGEGRAGKARAVGLIGRILRDIKTYDGEPERGTGYEEALRETLAIFEPGGTGAQVVESVRVEVGDALGQGGDPRLAGDVDNRVLIRGGSFWMGAQRARAVDVGHDPEAFDDREAPVHRVRISDFRLGRYPVTAGEFRAFIDAGGYRDAELWDPEGWNWRSGREIVSLEYSDRQLRYPNRPVVNVSWYEADAYCRWVGGRLPAEAEWEFAARGEEGRRFPWGNDEPKEGHANFDNRVGQPTPVGIYPLGMTPAGVHDLAGNVWEWCRDWYGAYEAAEQTDPEGAPSGSARVSRGGSFGLNPRLLRAAYRGRSAPGFRFGFSGFRVTWVASGGLDAN